MYVTGCRNMAIVQLITDANPGLVPAVDAEGDTPLHNACRGGHPDIARHLLSLGASVTALNRAGQTPRGTCGTDIEAAVAEVLSAAEGQ